MILETNCCGSTGNWNRVMWHLTPYGHLTPLYLIMNRRYWNRLPYHSSIQEMKMRVILKAIFWGHLECPLWTVMPYNMNSMKVVIPLHSLHWSIHTKDEGKHGTAFALIFGMNWLWCCVVTVSFGVFFHNIKCYGMISFMEFMMTSQVRLFHERLLSASLRIPLQISTELSFFKTRLSS